MKQKPKYYSHLVDKLLDREKQYGEEQDLMSCMTSVAKVTISESLENEFGEDTKSKNPEIQIPAIAENLAISILGGSQNIYSSHY